MGLHIVLGLGRVINKADSNISCRELIPKNMRVGMSWQTHGYSCPAPKELSAQICYCPLARTEKPHLVPWDLKVHFSKFKLCFKSLWKAKIKKDYLLTYPCLFSRGFIFCLTYCKPHFSLVSTFHKKVSRWFVISFLFITRCTCIGDYCYVPEFLEYITYEL